MLMDEALRDPIELARDARARALCDEGSLMASRVLFRSMRQDGLVVRYMRRDAPTSIAASAQDGPQGWAAR